MSESGILQAWLLWGATQASLPGVNASVLRLLWLAFLPHCTLMPDEKVRSSKLKFKGEKTKKKRKREDADDSGAGGSSSSRKRREEDDKDPETWVLPENSTDIRGPTFLIHPSDPSPICVTYDATRGRVAVVPLDRDVKVDIGDRPLVDRVPADVSQVWVVTRVAGSTTINLCVYFVISGTLSRSS
jgi:protein FRG1